MCSRLVYVMLLVVASHRAYSQSLEAINPEDTNAEEQTPIDAPEEPEESRTESLPKTTDLVPITEEEPTTEAFNSEDKIQCPSNLCTCTLEQDDDSMKVKADCSSQNLTALPSGIDRRVTHLLLNKNNLEELPKDIAEFKELEELNVNDNNIFLFVFGSVSQLPKLRVLKAANNRLTEFPRELKNEQSAINLQELDFGNNDMKEELVLDYFTHMQNLSLLTLPTSSQDLLTALCYRLGPTLQKVCTNDCSVDEEECTNYHEQTDDLITVSKDTEQIQDENETDYVSGEKNKQTDELIAVSNDSETKLKNKDAPEQNIEQPSDTDSNDKESQADSEISEPNEETVKDNSNDTYPSTILPEAVPSPTTENSVPQADFSFRNAVSATGGADGIAEVIPVSEDKVPTSKGVSPALKTMSVLVEQAPPSNAAINKEENDQADGNAKVGAASVKTEGGIDNSVIALIVAGMIIVVAGVTIKKNWSAIKGKFSSRPTPATAATHDNGTTPEEVPLQDKANIV